MKPRLLAQEDYTGLSSFLNNCFAQYPVATAYTQDLLAFFGRWMWHPADLSFALDHQDEVCGLALCGQRPATLGGHNLHVVHMGPIAVCPTQRRRGVGARLIEIVETHARERNVDLLTLTAAASHRAHRLYLRSGFQIVEAYRPLERHFTATPPLRTGLDLEVSLEDWESALPAHPPRPGAVAETLTRPSWVPQTLCPRYFLAEGAGVATLRWPLTQRHRGQESRVYATQIIHRFGSGAPLEAAVEAAGVRAAEDGAICTYALPTVAELLTSHSRTHAGLTYRMAKPLTEQAQSVLQMAAAWDECCPAP